MHDERVGGRAAFGPENGAAGGRVERVGGEAVNRLGRHRDETTAGKDGGQPGQIARGGAQNAGGTGRFFNDGFHGSIGLDSVTKKPGTRTNDSSGP